jgi:hypothetical protein
MLDEKFRHYTYLGDHKDAVTVCETKATHGDVATVTIFGHQTRAHVERHDSDIAQVNKFLNQLEATVMRELKSTRSQLQDLKIAALEEK